MTYSDYIVYVDESGDHGPASVDSDYPVFVLNFCMFQKIHYANTVVPKMQTFEFQHFGHDMVVLHENAIREQKPPFAFLKSQQKRAAFMENLDRLIEQADFTIAAVSIGKLRPKSAYGRPADPYEPALCFCMERAHAFSRDRDRHTRTTQIIVERRGKCQDDASEWAFRRIRDGANHWGAMPGFEILFRGQENQLFRPSDRGPDRAADRTARPCPEPAEPRPGDRRTEAASQSGRDDHRPGSKVFP